MKINVKEIENILREDSREGRYSGRFANSSYIRGRHKVDGVMGNAGNVGVQAMVVVKNGRTVEVSVDFFTKDGYVKKSRIAEYHSLFV